MLLETCTERKKNVLDETKCLGTREMLNDSE